VKLLSMFILKSSSAMTVIVIGLTNAKSLVPTHCRD